MIPAPQSAIQGRNLHPAEAEKLERLAGKLGEAFRHAGHSDVAVCEAAGEGEHRVLTFLRRADGSPLISFTSIAFLASTSVELCQMIESHLTKPRTP